MKNCYLNFFGTEICIYSDNSILIERIHYIFRYFQSYNKKPDIYFIVSIRKKEKSDYTILDDGLLANGIADISYSYDGMIYFKWKYDDTFLPPLQIKPLAGQYLVLHGCAIRVQNQTVAFIAPSLGGKTTMVYHAVEQGAKCVTDDLIFIKDGQIMPYKKPVGIRDTNKIALNNLHNHPDINTLTLINPLGFATHLTHLDDLFEHPYYNLPSKIDWIIVPNKNDFDEPYRLNIYHVCELLCKSVCNSGIEDQALVNAIFTTISATKGALYLPTGDIERAYKKMVTIISQRDL